MDKKHIIINIGRQFGSGGKAVAKIIGEKLSIPVYDNELISKAAEDSGFSHELFLRSDEKRNIFSLYSFFSSPAYELTRNSIGDNELFRIQGDTIRSIAEKESAIFVGRCSNYILRDMDCLDVFLTAPLEQRTARIMERENLSHDEAEKYVLQKEKTRKTYYDYFTFGNWGNASEYDVCMDTSALGIERTAEVILGIAKLKWNLD